ncbi:MAG: hypothetical protein WA532_03895, partial [Candidatus Korobacteraceae bacterium]
LFENLRDEPKWLNSEPFAARRRAEGSGSPSFGDLSASIRLPNFPMRNRDGNLWTLKSDMRRPWYLPPTVPENCVA